MDGNTSGEPNYVPAPTIQCYDCHDYHMGGSGINDNPPNSSFASSHKPQNIAFGFTRGSVGSMTEDPPAGTVSGYYENKPPYLSSPSVYLGADPNLDPADSVSLLKTGGHYFKRKDPTGTASDEFDIGDKLTCRDCHDPHAYSTSRQAFIRQDLPVSNAVGSLTSVTASEYMANSFPGGSRINSESRKICAACHAYSNVGTPVYYSNISSKYNIGQGTITRPTATIGEHASGSSIACVSCHSHNSIDASCSDCHGFPPSDTATIPYPPSFTPVANPGGADSHARHFGAKSGESPNTRGPYFFNCDVCHYGSYGTGAGSLAMHSNSHVSVIINGAWTSRGSGYDNTNYYNFTYGTSYAGELDNTAAAGGWGRPSGTNTAGWNTCRNVYCHSAGRVVSTMPNDCTALYPRPTWNSGSLHCNDCHGYGTDDTTNGGINFGMPSYASGAAGSATANSHAAHVVTANVECSVCHALTAAGTRASRTILSTVPTLHVDGKRDVNFDGTHASGTYDNTIGNKTCSVSCHGSGTPQWGGTLVNGCFDCHAGAETLYKPQDNILFPNPVNSSEYLYSGHGRSGSNYTGSANLPAGFSNYTTAPAACYVCHSLAASHLEKSANDPFRLGHATDGTTGGMGTWTGAWADNTDVLCLGCHGTATERSGHDNAAQGIKTVDVQTHARGLMSNPNYSWPVTPWKCVDCHDPHGDGRSGAERYMMMRSGINAPSGSTDSSAGSDTKSRPRRTDSNVRAVSFTSLSGYAAGSYTQPGNGTGGTWGPCEVCHTQTTAYSRTLDNTSTHATRTNRCTTCHPHKAAFAPTACKGCHGPDSVAVAARAPDMGAYWTSSGHGRFTTGSPARPIECEDCHDGSYLTVLDHKTDGSVAGSPPNNINTEYWPGKSPTNADTNPNRNTSHLRSVYDNTGATVRSGVARAFDNYCALACHSRDYHRHQKNNGAAPRDVMRFGDPGTSTTSNPKQYNWYSYSSFPSEFYRSQSPIVDNDLFSRFGTPSDGAYGVCVSCHDPHGTATTDTKGGGAQATNAMVRGNWKTDATGFCSKACHTSRTPP